jgi:SMC interacting uncharacterized protein involved in chromosome segregation
MFNLGLNKKVEEVIKIIEEFAKDTDQRLDNLEKVALAQEMNLKEHMRRSDQLEQLIQMESEKREKELEKIELQMEKSSKHINMVEGGLKLLGIVATVVAIAAGIGKLLSLI